MTWFTELEPLTWPDAEQVACSYLTANLAGVKALSRPPEQKPPTFVVVERAGGIPAGLVDTARLALQCWGTTKQSAQALALTCRDLLTRMRGQSINGFTVYSVTEVLGPTWALDPDGNLPRYLLTVEARFRANPKGT